MTENFRRVLLLSLLVFWGASRAGVPSPRGGAPLANENTTVKPAIGSPVRAQSCDGWSNPASVPTKPGIVTNTNVFKSSPRALNGCGFDSWIIDDFTSAITFKRVVVKGERAQNASSTTICEGEACWTVIKELSAVVLRENFSSMDPRVTEEVFARLFPKIPVNACLTNHPNPEKNQEAKNTTSIDPVEIRGLAADSIIRATGQNISAHGRDFTVTYSDGGSETIKFNFYGTTQVASAKDYKQGSGKSRCPA